MSANKKSFAGAASTQAAGLVGGDITMRGAPDADAGQESHDRQKTDRQQEPDIQLADLSANLAIEFPEPSGMVVNNGEPAGIPLPPVYKPVVQRSHDEICQSLTHAAENNDLPLPFFIRLLFQESRFKAGVVSSAGAQGIAQFMPETAVDMGLRNPFDPLQAIPASARLLRDLVKQFGNLGLAAAAYNAGPKRIQDWLEKKGNLPQETQGYVKTITGHEAETWTAAATRHPQQKLPRRAPCQEAAGRYAWNGPGAIPVPQPSPVRQLAARKLAAVKIGKADKTDKDAKAETADKNVKIVKTTKPSMPHSVKPATRQLAARKRKLDKIAQR